MSSGSGIGSRIARNLDMGAAKGLLAVSMALTCIGLYLNLLDFQASVQGWGLSVAGWFDTGGLKFGAIALSIVPQLVQIAYGFGLSMGGFKDESSIARQPAFMVLAGTSFVVDNYADSLWIASRGAMSQGKAMLIAVGIFTILSEVLVSFFGAVTMAALKEMRGRPSASIPGPVGPAARPRSAHTR